MDQNRLSSKGFILGLAAAIFIYFSLSLYQINLPGLHYDEAFEAVPGVQLLAGLPVTSFRDSGLQINGQIFPFMTQDYIGAINTYTALPFIMVLGTTPAALRVMSIMFGAITLGLSAWLALRLSGQRWAGVLVAFLLAVDPTFIFWNRQGVFVTAITAAIGLGATYCWLRRLQYLQKGAGHTIRWSMAGAFLFGLGLYAKLLFIWLIGALFAAVIILNLSDILKQRSQLITKLALTLKECAALSLAFLLGCWPLIAYNLQTGGTFLNVSENASTSYYGVNNLAFASNLMERSGQLYAMLGSGQFWYLGRVVQNEYAVFLFCGLFFMVTLTAIRSSPALPDGLNFSPAKVALFPYLVIAFVLLASIVTVSALWITHFAILMAWPALAIALGSWFVATHLNRTSSLQRTFGWILGVCLVLLWLTNLASTIRYHIALTESGGLSAHSDAVYDLTEWLERNAQGQVVAMDWGLAAPVTYLTAGQVNAVEIFGYGWLADQNLNQRLQRFIAQPETLYLWRTPEEVIFDRSDDFKALYRPQNLEETIEEAFYERSGRPLLGITRLVPAGTADNPP